jgi:hypothetical protein
MLRFGGEDKQEYMDGRGALQDEVYVRVLAIDFFISLVNTVDAWADRTVAEINTWESLTIGERNKRAMELLANVPVATPTDPSTSTPVAPSSQL